MDRDWSRLGTKLGEARKAAGLSQPQLAQQIGVGRATIQNIEAGTAYKKITGAIRGYAQAVGWTGDSAERVLNGGEPEVAVPPAPESEGATDLPPAVAMELRSGRTLDSTVLHFGREDDPDARVIVVLKGDADITEEELDAMMKQWRRARRKLQGIASDTDASSEH